MNNDKPSSESSHSPTEQPGDSANNYKCADCGTAINEGEFKTFGICDDCWDRHHKKVQPANNSDEEFKKLVMDTFHELYPYSSGPHLNELFVIAERASKYERSKQDELVAQLKACRAEVLRVAKEGEKWMMEAERLKSELLYRDVTVIPEKDAEFERLEHAKIESEKFITSEFFRVRDINFKLTRERDVLQSENAKQSAELEQLRSERDKMREALENLIDSIYDPSERETIDLTELEAIDKAKSALSGCSKQ